MTTYAPSTAPSPTEQLLPAPGAGVLLREADRFGLSRDRLRGSSWERLSRGLYDRRVPTRDVRELARVVGLVLPRDSGFGQLTSAGLRGWWMPHALGTHVLFATTTSAVHAQRRGLYVRRSRFGEFEQLDGVAVSTAPQTLIELAGDLALVDLVPMVDCALRDGADPDSILAAARPTLRGAGRLRRAVSLADHRSESWWESILRLLHVLAGVGPVDCQPTLWSLGRFVARADLHLVGTLRYPEVDGGRHREQKRHDSDLRRDKGMSRLRVERYGYTTREIITDPGMVIRDAEAARGWSHDPRRLRAWWRFARESSLTAYGRRRLAARLDRYRQAAERSSAANVAR